MKTTIDDQEYLHQLHRVGYDRVEQIWEGVLGDGLEGNFWEEGLPLCVQSKFEGNGLKSSNFTSSQAFSIAAYAVRLVLIFYQHP